MTVKINESSSSGNCSYCGKRHYIEQGEAREHCLVLMKTLEENGRIDFHLPDCEANPRLSLDYIKGEARGQMFGVLECQDVEGNPVILKAFSGQYNGIWNVEGWAPPLLDTEKFESLVNDADKKVKVLGARMDKLPEGLEREELFRKRKNLSRNLMKEIHALYRVHNFRSETRLLFDFFKKGIPTGTGDCCAPKLLNAAAKRKLLPKSMAEIFWGRTNRSGTRQQGKYYTACLEKCQPILGFMLCGIK
jgi:hypothetical protein